MYVVASHLSSTSQTNYETYNYTFFATAHLVALDPGGARHHDVQHSALSVQHALVDGALVLGELATHRELQNQNDRETLSTRNTRIV